MKLVWSSTGDSLELELVDPAIFEYWVSQVSSGQKNKFRHVDSTFVDTTGLAAAVAEVNTILVKFNIDTFVDPGSDWYDQNNLNILHEQWVKLQHKHKNIVQLLSKFPNNLVKTFHDINHLIHKIEDSVTIVYDNDKDVVWQTPNIFGSDILKFGTWHAELTYQNLGRSTFEKWMHYDTNLVDSDTNNFTHFGGQIQFNICRPIELKAPVEYIDYCNKNNVCPYGNKLPIGNFKESITDLRHVFNKNVNIENNTISFKI